MNYQVQKSSTGLTFNYKINMDFLINNKKKFVDYKNGYFQVSTHIHIVLIKPFFCHCLHIKTCFCSEKIDLVSHMELTNKK